MIELSTLMHVCVNSGAYPFLDDLLIPLFEVSAKAVLSYDYDHIHDGDISLNISIIPRSTEFEVQEELVLCSVDGRDRIDAIHRFLGMMLEQLDQAKADRILSNSKQAP